MADVSKIQLPSGSTYNIKDKISGYITTAIFKGTCASDAAETAKVVVCEDFTSNNLKAGAAILVTFSETNSGAVADLTLNVNSTGAKSIKYINNGTLGNLSSAGYLKASTTYLFVYDGSYWVAYFNYNTTYSSMTEAEITAGTGTTARTITPARLKTAIGTWQTDTKNTTGSTNTTSKIFLVGSLEQGAETQTYSNSGLYFSNGLRSSASSSGNSSEILQGSSLIKLSVNDEDSNYAYTISLNEAGSRFGIIDSSIVTSGVFVSDTDGKTYIYNVATPTNSTDVANKSYVDTRIINPATKTSGQFLMYNGTSWVAQSLPIYDGTVVTS